MKTMTSAEIRQKFLDFFFRKGHQIVPSSQLVPLNDPTLLFTNAGMVQFKEVFLGEEHRDYVRATSSQRCVRAGGKHNDLENVGYTARHHTFFEMLGKFSFGDYFKREAIHFAWEFLTQELALPPEKLWITVFAEDNEAADIWLKELKVDAKRFSRCGEKDNFWAMGETGPCGPCTEIFYDHGEAIAGGPPGTPEEDGDRYVEIWNLVFMQYNRQANGKIIPLEKPSVDTGMGLERISAVMQGVHNNYDTDLFQPIIKRIAKIAKIKDLTHTSCRVIADHIRSAAFLIADGVVPSNEGRGYVLRRIIRRALRHGHQLGIEQNFFFQLVEPLIDIMGSAYAELITANQRIVDALKREETLFAETLNQGMKIFTSTIKDLKQKVIPGDMVFKLYDTYGFPVDLTADIAREKGLTIDEAGFQTAMEQQRQRSQQSSQFKTDYNETLKLTGSSEFYGYESLEKQSKIRHIDQRNQTVDAIKAGDEAIIVLDETPFYAESGGQIGDQGVIQSGENLFIVKDTQKQGKNILHTGFVKTGAFHLQKTVTAVVDHKRRQAAALNHSATHLLNAALRETLGDHVLQKGSLVEPERLRFDFSHFEALNPQQLQQVETLVNQQIRANLKVETKIMTPEQAMDSGAIALFGEKYGAEVRVLCMGDFSMELCGGTHVNHSGDIGVFKIVSESGIAAGIRRIEALTGQYALDWIAGLQKNYQQISYALKADSDAAVKKLQDIMQQLRQSEKEIARLKQKVANQVEQDLSQFAKDYHGVKILTQIIAEADNKQLRHMIDDLKSKLQKAIIVLASKQNNKANLVVGITNNLTDRYNAQKLINHIAQKIDGKGGGRPDLAMAGGSKPEYLAQALALVPEWLDEQG
ncbi:MAG: alanine--tRNA ligase [Pseudomonadota bacterium]